MASPSPAVGQLAVVATPLGNLGDLSPRARQTLLEADLIVAEDTRSLQRLLADAPPRAERLASHGHNEAAVAERVADAVAAGQRVALISDAGTPAISDPGFRAVRECRRRGLRVVPIPGPCAAIAALSASGLPSDSFLFLGFPQPRSAPRRALLEKWRDCEATLILYESPHRIGALLEDIVELYGPHRLIAVARELTKLYETFHVGEAGIVRQAVAKGSQKGEFVVLIAKADYTL